MENSKKTKLTTIALILLLTITIPLTALPAANAHTPPWTYTSYAYVIASPDPIGVGQRVYMMMWVDWPFQGATVDNNIRRIDYKLTITKPDGTTEIKTWDIINDPTGVNYISYTPTQVGTYTLFFEYPGQKYIWTQANTPGLSASAAAYQNDTFGSASATTTLNVQQEPLSDPKNSYPLPTEYWTRPIEGQNTDWWTISSNWMGYTIVGTDVANDFQRVQPDGSAPNSAHILWTKPIDDGGLIGGSKVGIEGNTFYMGLSYNVRFGNPIIMQGRLFYELPRVNDGTGGGWMAVDLRTGEEIWFNDLIGFSGSGVPNPTFGYTYAAETENQHGAPPPGFLFANNFAAAYNPINGRREFNVTNVPTGFEIGAPHGERLRFQISLANRWIAQWNSSKMWNMGTSLDYTPYWNQTNGWVIANVPITPARPTTSLGTGRVWGWNGTAWDNMATTPGNAAATPRYDWNITIPTGIPTGSTIRYVLLDDILLGSDLFVPPIGSIQKGVPDYSMWVLSMKPETRGNLLWIKNYTAPPGNGTRYLTSVDPINRVFITTDKETMTWNGYSLNDGSQLWTTIRPNGTAYEYFSTGGSVAYSRFYYAGYGGKLYAVDTKNGSILWTYGGNNGPGNNTFQGLETAWGDVPVFIGAIADGKVYLYTSEHSPNTPMNKDAKMRAIDAYTGKELWTMMGYGVSFAGSLGMAVADGILVYENAYDSQIYAVGKGPSALTVLAPDVGVELGKSLVIRGTVTDIAAGTKQNEQAARFPNGVPAVSDESMGAWMEYVYMQKPRPMTATGIEVVLSVLDSNNNYREIGKTTSNSDGFFTFSWIPDIEGQYTVYASFAGSESYWPSHAVTSLAVDPATATPAPTATPQSNIATTTDLITYLVAGVIAIIIAIAIVGLLILRKRP